MDWKKPTFVDDKTWTHPPHGLTRTVVVGGPSGLPMTLSRHLHGVLKISGPCDPRHQPAATPHWQTRYMELAAAWRLLLWPRQSHACTKHRTHIHIASELPNPKPTTSKTPSKVAPYFKFEIVRQNNKLGMKPRLPAKQAHTPSPHSFTPQSSGGRDSSEQKEKTPTTECAAFGGQTTQERDGTGSHRGRPSGRATLADTWRLMTDLRPDTLKP